MANLLLHCLQGNEIKKEPSITEGFFFILNAQALFPQGLYIQG